MSVLHFVFSSGNPKVVVGEQLRRAILSYYNFIRPKEMPEERELVEIIEEPAESGDFEEENIPGDTTDDEA